MQLFVRVFRGAVFAVAVAIMSTQSALAVAVSPNHTLCEFDQEFHGIAALNAVHVIVRSIPVRF